MAVKKQPDIYVCDRCGHETTHPDDRRDHTEGHTTLSYRGGRGGMCYGGDWGGTSHHGEAWLCSECTNKFLDFMEGK